MSLHGHTALITGAGRGIGRAIALQLAEAKAAVVVTARSKDELEEVTETITAAGGQAALVVCDLADRAQSTQLVAEAGKPFGDIDILVNNAGVGSASDPRPLADYRDEFWDLSLEVNMTVPYLLSKAALPAMRSKGWGRIITIASINGKQANLHAGAYAASKHGVIGLMRALALEHASEGITVNSICPGPVKTQMNDIRIQYDADRLGMPFEELEKTLTPVGGRLVPEDIAPMAVYLASDAARMITGQSYNIDGGRQMS